MTKPTEQIYANYTAEDFTVWKTLFNRQMDILHTAVSDEYLQAINKVGFADNKIPDFIELNQILKQLTGWNIQVVPNICPEDKFFQCIANKIFTGILLNSV